MKIGDAVSWASPEPAPVWLNLAREFTERWHHQQQIRDATGQPPLYDRYFLAPVLDTFVRALPYAFRSTDAPAATVVRFEISGEASGIWYVYKSEAVWILLADSPRKPSASVVLPQDVAWRLFTKGIDRGRARGVATIEGRNDLADPIFAATAPSVERSARCFSVIVSEPAAVIPSAVAMQQGEYGYDAPYMLVIFGCVAVVSGIGAAIGWGRMPTRSVTSLMLYFVFFLGNFISFFYTTRRGKFIEWERILDGTQLRGDEMVLDMGCGRGAVLTAVARRLKTGQVTGVDIWSTTDQSGNAKDVTLRNASIEGVSDRVQIETADMRALPFPDATFDLVVSSLAIHNIRSNADRRKAVAEGFRVMKPGGRMVIADIRATGVYVQALRALGASRVERRRLGWRFWWGNPVAATTLLTASKSSV